MQVAKVNFIGNSHHLNIIPNLLVLKLFSNSKTNIKQRGDNKTNKNFPIAGTEAQKVEISDLVELILDIALMLQP